MFEFVVILSQKQQVFDASNFGNIYIYMNFKHFNGVDIVVSSNFISQQDC